MSNVSAGGSVVTGGQAAEMSSSSSGSYGIAKTFFGVLGIMFILIAIWMGCCNNTSERSFAFPRVGRTTRRGAHYDTKYMRAGDSDMNESLTSDEGGIELL